MNSVEATKTALSAVVIGGSAGAIEVLTAILPALPANFPTPVVMVLHIPPDRTSLLAELFGRQCAMKVREAEHGERTEPGVIYFAPPNYHLLVEPNLTLSLSVDEQVHFSRPSIDVLFESAAIALGNRLLGVVLTGASSDGAIGLRAIVDRGGRAIVQDPASAECQAMPYAALQLCPEAECLSPDQIAGRILVLLPSGVT